MPHYGSPISCSESTAAQLSAREGASCLPQLVGNDITSLDMQGFSISALRKADGQKLGLWDAHGTSLPQMRWGMGATDANEC